MSGRLIDADALMIDIVEEGQANRRHKYKVGDFWELNGAEIRTVVDAQPTAEPVRHGKWSQHTLGTTGGYGTTVMHQCSECESMTISRFRYCPNCGARMDEE